MSRILVAACAGLILISLTAPAVRGARCILQLDRPEDLLLGPSLELKQTPASLAKAPTPRQRADRPLDVIHYDLALDVSLESEALSGTVALRVVTLAPTDTLVLDLLTESSSDGAGMAPTSPVRVGGVDRPFEHVADQLRILLAETAAAGDTLDAEVGFAGTPVRDFILGYRLRNFFDRDDPELPVLEDEPVLMTLSEPDAARSWWPCHDHPFDAATVELSVTAPARFTLAAPGLLVVDENLPGGMRRQQWSMTSPIPTYLVSINLADYVTWQEDVALDHLVDAATGQVETRTMPIQYYVPSFEEANARYTWSNTSAMIEEFADLFGPYPFADLKYGMSLFQFGGAMEHPTMSSMGQFTISSVENEFGAPAGEWVSAHELAHQWFGDAVRVERWGEIWLNEGFAQWAEALWFERFYGEEAGRLWLDALWREEFPGTLVDPGAFFGNTVYKKGARVVHQLRQVMGDEDFFAALRNYVTDPELRFARAASSADLQTHCEALYGESLDWFFDPWLNWEGRPSLRALRHPTGDGMRLVVRQPADRVYRLPLPVRLQLADGTEEDRVVWIGDSGPETVVELNSPAGIREIEIDPDRDWLLDLEVARLDQRAELVNAFPNPFNPSVNLEYFVGEPMRVRLDVYDLRGRLVRRILDAEVGPGIRSERWDGVDEDGSTVASGTYLVVLTADGGIEERRTITLIK